ncbi:MAG: hypothetical protein DSY76_01605 [Bacteroidetes bacterium]|nr:MAG: hypothetical protein DSY76_01605 [Bacteroidota bacterium]
MRIQNKWITLLFSALLVLFSGGLTKAQSTSASKSFRIACQTHFSPKNVKQDYLPHLQHIDSVFVGNATYQSYLKDIKSQISTHNYTMIHSRSSSYERKAANEVDTAVVVDGYEGNHYNGGIPNDNTMAISNDGIVVSAINTNIQFYDTQLDSVLKVISLSKFSDTLTNVSPHQYDPKAIYDYENDRFILVYLAGSKSYESNIIVAFSQSNDPMGEWNIYSLPGNPLNDTSWTDYPAISLSHDELFITGNLLKDGGSWQTSFKQSVVWQIDKKTGYNGDSLTTNLHYDIAYNGKNVRNIHPVRGGNAFYGPEVYLLSNQNFALESDTFYLIKIEDNLSSGHADLNLDLLLSDTKYGMPPNAHQPGSKRLATNDARVLGAFYQNGQIQFVGNSLNIYFDGDTNKIAGFYHGVIKDVTNSPKLHLNIYSDQNKADMEYGYPNISYCGLHDESQQSLITVDYASKTHVPSFGSIFFEEDDTYSPLGNLYSGNTRIYILWSLQRWGDYSGSQPKYNEPGVVWASGTFGKKIGNKQAYGTWIASIKSPKKDVPKAAKEFSAKAYPNPPVNEMMSVEFHLTKDEEIKIEIVSINGQKVADLYDAQAKAGKNVFTFSTSPLENGLYLLRIYNNDKTLYTKKITIVQ